MNSNTQEYWCHNCSKITIPRHTLNCQYCHSEALELVERSNHPAHAIPFSLPELQPEPQEQPQPQGQSHFMGMPFPRSMIMDSFFNDAMQNMFSRQSALENDFMQTMMRMPVPTRSYRVVTFVMGPEAEEEKQPVHESTIESLEKVSQLGDDCAVCQEKEGGGMRLNCGHQFHEHCIRPWFQEKNTCPCCRAAQN